MGTSIEFHKVADREAGQNEDGTWALKHVALVGDAPAEHEFSEGYIMKALSEGWASMSEGNIVFHLVDGDLTYHVTSGPEDENEEGQRSGSFNAELVGGE